METAHSHLPLALLLLLLVLPQLLPASQATSVSRVRPPSGPKDVQVWKSCSSGNFRCCCLFRLFFPVLVDSRWIVIIFLSSCVCVCDGGWRRGQADTVLTLPGNEGGVACLWTQTSVGPSRIDRRHHKQKKQADSKFPPPLPPQGVPLDPSSNLCPHPLPPPPFAQIDLCCFPSPRDLAVAKAEVDGNKQLKIENCLKERVEAPPVRDDTTLQMNYVNSIKRGGGVVAESLLIDG